MSDAVRTALKQLCERWDGKGSPRRLAAEAIALPMRVSHVGDFTEMAHHRGGRGAALALLKKQAGHHFDPELVQTFLRSADALFAAIEGHRSGNASLPPSPAPTPAPMLLASRTSPRLLRKPPI